MMQIIYPIAMGLQIYNFLIRNVLFFKGVLVFIFPKVFQNGEEILKVEITLFKNFISLSLSMLADKL